jgi:hypothetical protein
MANNSFNLIELYQKVFNIKGVRFAIPTGNTDAGTEREVSNFTLDLPAVPNARAYSYLGTPIYEQISFRTTDREYTFPDWPLLDISAAKNIISTPIKGRNGTVKEHINIDDYQITIRGILINYVSDEYPEDLVYELHEIFKVNKELQVTNPLLNLMDIHNVVIKDIRFPEVEGYNHIQPFVIQCLSDEPVEIVIKYAKNQYKIKAGL